MRGGARKGAGRKPTPTPNKETIALRVSPEVKAKYNDLKAQGININQLIEQFICQQ